MKIITLDKPQIQRVKMNCDYCLHPKLKEFPMVDDAWSSHNFTIFAGKMGQGKTSLVVSLLKSVFKKVFHSVYVFIPEQSRASIDNDILKKNLPRDQLYSELTVENLSEVYEKVQENSSEGYNSLLIIDDFQTSLKDPTIINILQKIIVKMRHLRTTTWLIQQNFQALVKPLREVVSNLVMFNLGKSQNQKIFDELIQLDKDKYNDLVKLAFQDPHDWILINLNKSKKIYRMFDEINLEEE
jgi:thymidine kinase